MGHGESEADFMNILTAENIVRSFASSAGTVLDGVSLCVQEGDIFVVLGHSGCGKSTLLRVLGGFDAPDAGSVFLDGTPVTKPRRDMVMMFQSFEQLFPWFTLQENLVYALRKTGIMRDKEKAAVRAAEYLQKTGLAGFEHAYPHTLSGGMKQRGALARALCLAPKVLLMDEPFSSLDFLTHKAMQDTLLELQQTTHTTIVLVTHDIDEALRLGHTITVLQRGTKQLCACEKRKESLEGLLTL